MPISTDSLKTWLSDNGLLLVAVGAPIVVFLLIAGVLVLEYQTLQTEQVSLEEQITKFSEIARRSQTREGDTEADFLRVQDAFPPKGLTEIDVFRTMRNLAEEMGLDINQLVIEQTADAKSSKVGKSTYRVMSFRMTTSGKFDRVLSLVQRLDQGQTPYETLVLGRLDLTVGEQGSATVEFKIYGLPG